MKPEDTHEVPPAEVPSGDAPEALGPQDSADAALEFPCEACGAGMTWDPESDALSCAYCGHTVQVPRGEGLIVERALEDAGDAARGLGVEVEVSDCRTCGARVTFDERSTSEACVYCGSASVLEQRANRNALRPESLVPLDVAEAHVREGFRRWVRGLWFRPNALKNTKRFDAAGLYVPFWTYDCHAHSDWSANAGYYYYVMEPTVVMVNGKPKVRMRQVRKTRWEPAWGSRDDRYDDVLVLASRGLPEDLLAKLGGFDLSALVPYRPEYLAGWRAEEYALDLESGWAVGQERVVEHQRVRCSGDVPGDTQRNLQVKNVLSDVRWKHLLLPVWSLQYRFRGEVYTVLVHGQTGKVVGKAPLSWLKILGLVAAVALIVLAVVLVSAA